MQYRKLGNSNIDVSVICLGSMTWGEQNTEAEAHEQLDYAFSEGVNFIDTAEMYAVPPRKETQGLTETYIGSWLSKQSNREKIVLATKVIGPEEWFDWVRDGKTRLNNHHIRQALEGSFKRLQTDYIDLYQLHWPDRNTNELGERQFVYKEDETITPIAETLEVLGALIKEGKIKHYGLSNETGWGAMTFLRLADEMNIPRPVSIQNNYSLTNRTYEVDMAEISIRENVGLLAYFALGCGILTGKYLNGQRPENSRLVLTDRFGRFLTPELDIIVEKYVNLAKKSGLNPAQMALAFANQQPFLTSTIIGATKMGQLKSNIESINITLTKDVLDAIEAIHDQHPNPRP